MTSEISSSSTADLLVDHIISSSNSASLFSYFGDVLIPSRLTEEKLKEDLKAAFRKYARIIHPDKCTSSLANEAFVKLKDAYDDLVNNISSNASAASVRNNSRFYFQTGILINNTNSSFIAHSCRSAGSQSKKRQQQDQNNCTDDADDARMRYTLRRQMRKQFAQEKHSVDEDIEHFLSSVNVESHSNDWNKFISKNKKLRSSEQDTSHAKGQPSGDAEVRIPNQEASSHSQELAPGVSSSTSFICYLCERKFASFEKQERHIAESALHLKNVQMMQKQQNI